MGEGGVKSLKKLPTSFMDGPQGGDPTQLLADALTQLQSRGILHLSWIFTHSHGPVLYSVQKSMN